MLTVKPGENGLKAHAPTDDAKEILRERLMEIVRAV
jgi:hypothetical protein